MENRTTELVKFNIRVYGIWINARDEILLSRETHHDYHEILKFPGGGLELGEGAIEGLQREFYEETSLQLLDYQHYYTTDFFQQSYFNPEDQIISLYYLVHCSESESIVPLEQDDEFLGFEWHALADLNPEDLPLPIDQHVAENLVEEHALGLTYNNLWGEGEIPS